jgi:hypothetical protein
MNVIVSIAPESPDLAVFSELPVLLFRLENVDPPMLETSTNYWAHSEDVAASQIANVVSIQQIDAAYGDDAYGMDDEWAETVPDLGENA